MSTYEGAPRHSKGGGPSSDSPKGVMSKTARHSKIITLLEQHEVRSQSELAVLLADDGVQVSEGPRFYQPTPWIPRRAGSKSTATRNSARDYSAQRAGSSPKEARCGAQWR